METLGETWIDGKTAHIVFDYDEYHTLGDGAEDITFSSSMTSPFDRTKGYTSMNSYEGHTVVHEGKSRFD